MKLYERLNLRPTMWDYRTKIPAIEICKQVYPNASDFDRAWGKCNLASSRSILSLACYYSDEIELAKVHGTDCIAEIEDFLFGEWRSQFQASEKKIDPGWWKREFIWMQSFAAALLWGSVLGKWEFLKRVGEFPESDSCISDGYRAQDRDLYVAWGAFLRGATDAELEPLLTTVENRNGRSCKLVTAAIRAGMARSAVAFQKALNKLLEHYRKNEFPKEYVTKKISFEGTFFVHWAEKEGIPVTVPPEFLDHIVRLQ